MRKLLLQNFQSPGDVVMLTAAVRDLHRAHPGKFITDTRTACAGLWENNPYITPLSEDDPEVEKIDCEYPLVHKSNTHPVHFIHGFIDDLRRQLGVAFEATEFRGDIHLSEEERRLPCQVHEITGEPLPFWIMTAGGKSDFTIKWWDAARWQQVVDHFRGRILFVQAGEEHPQHHHPQLDAVLDLRGKTTLRQIVRLVHHAQGVICPVTFLMHLAAAVEAREGAPKNRPCVVIGGGREPMHWEAYPHHQFIHTNGALLCCDQGGCWKSRTVALGDGEGRDRELCVDVVMPGPDAPDVTAPLPRCMDLITAAAAARRIELYFRGGTAEYLTPEQAQCAGRAIQEHTAARRMEKLAARETKAGKGVVFITVSDQEFFPGTAATVSSILHFHPAARICVVNGHIQKRSLTDAQREVFTSQDVQVVDAQSLAGPGRRLNAWELKAYAACDLAGEDEVLVGIDSDCVLCTPIDDLFEKARSTGRFVGGHDQDVDYDESYRAYGIETPVRNQRYMSTALYACALNDENRASLQKWAACCDRAKFGDPQGEYPGHGDQGVLNAILHAERGGAGVRLLRNALWTQHWCYWEQPLSVKSGRLFNENSGAFQRAMHCGGTEKFWEKNHFDRVQSTGQSTVNYAWFLALLWFGACRVRVEHLSPENAHLAEALAYHRAQVMELAAQLDSTCPGSMTAAA